MKHARRTYDSAHCTDEPDAPTKCDINGTPSKPAFSSVISTYANFPDIQTTAPPLQNGTGRGPLPPYSSHKF